MSEIQPGTLTYYNEIARLMSLKEAKLTGNKAAINAHIGGQFFFSPHQMALDAHIHHTAHHTSLLGYLDSLAKKEQIPLMNLLKKFCPENGYFINLYEGYQDLWRQSEKNNLTFKEFLNFQKNQQIGSTGYLDYTTGQIEGLTLMRNYFRNLGIPVGENQIVMGTGFKNLYHTLMNVFMTEDVCLDDRGRDLRKRTSGTILVPKGHYQSLVKAPSFHNSRLKIIEKMDGENLRRELETREDIKAAYLSVVANPSGEIMPEEQMRGISEVVLDYNRKNKDNPVFVIADQVYNGSILKKGLEIFSIASISDKSLRMFDYTITIVSPSKTLGYASARIGFATSGVWIPGDSKSLISRMAKILDNEGCDGIEVSNEVGVVAAYAFSSKAWIDNNSAYIRKQLHRARKYVDAINNDIGKTILEVNDPDAGWYLLSKFKRDILPDKIRTSKDLMVYFMNYNHCNDNSGFISRPGAQFGYEAVNLPEMDHLILRTTMAMQPEDLDDLFRRFREGIVKLVALKELETISPENIMKIKKSTDEIEDFISKNKKELLTLRMNPDLYSILMNGGNSQSISRQLHRLAEEELKTILEE